MQDWHALTTSEAFNRLGVTEHGLSAKEAIERLHQHGRNRLTPPKPEPPILAFLRQFQSPLIYVLLFAFFVALFVNHTLDAAVIAVVVLLNAIIGFLQERNAQDAIKALQKMTAPHATVLRDGEPLSIFAEEIVPGDILILTAGDRVGADARVLRAVEFEVDEAALTGESLPVSKHPGALQVDLPLGDRTNLVFQSTVVTRGHGRALVVATGMQTEIGRISKQVAEAESVAPLQRKLEDFSQMIAIGVSVLAVLFVGIGILRGLGFVEIFLVALSMAVSAIPEGLPLVVTLLLAVGVYRMAKRKALVRRLPSVESLGAATVICSDKTGTLTRNTMTVREVVMVGKRSYRVTGEGYAPFGTFEAKEVEEVEEAEEVEKDQALVRLLEAADLCNDASLREREGNWEIIGDPTEGALVVLAAKRGIDRDWERLDEIPFSSERKWMATVNRPPDGSPVGFVKGALERLLSMSNRVMDQDGSIRPIEERDIREINRAAEELARKTFRVLAFGFLPEVHELTIEQSLDGGVVLLGLVGMMDPPRMEAIQAIKTCQEAGIRVVMITGDHVLTARAIAQEMGILKPSSEVVEGRELETLSEETLADRAERIDVYARVAPEHKLRIVKALQERGNIVAMTGDGVNDAPAISQADVGVSMGITGTEVAKGASDMVIADDNFATIEGAVEEGRLIVQNLRKVIRYLFATNLGEVLILTAALVLGLPLPLLAAQILWINLVTDGAFDKTIAMEPPESNLMKVPPRSPKAPLIDREILRWVFLFSTVMMIGTLFIFAFELRSGASLAKAQTMAFSTTVFFQWFSAFTFRSSELPIYRLKPNPWIVLGVVVAAILHALVLYLPFLQLLFRTVPLSPSELGLTLLVSSSLLWLGEAIKIWKTTRGKAPRAEG